MKSLVKIILLFWCTGVYSQIHIDSARTIDANGNGLLDGLHIYLQHSDRADFIAASRIRIWYNLSKSYRKEFLIDSIRYEGADPNSLIAFIREQDLSNTNQTGWHLIAAITNDSGSLADSCIAFDGAGPVIKWVNFYIPADYSKNKRKIELCLSEACHFPPDISQGNTEQISNNFYLWFKNNSNQVFTDTSILLIRIDSISKMSDSLISYFLPENILLTSGFYLSLKSPGDGLMDLHDNRTIEMNQKVRIMIKGYPDDIVIGPNPLKPINQHLEFNTDSLPNRDSLWSTSEGGAAFSVSYSLQDSQYSNVVIKTKLNIYNSNGKFVYSRSNATNSGSSWVPLPSWEELMQSNSPPFAIYWDGITNDGSPAPGGKYKYVLTFEREGMQKTFESYLWIDADEDPAERYGDCGTGLQLAFLPLFWLGMIKIRKKRDRW
jgi:hypothetical protein